MNRKQKSVSSIKSELTLLNPPSEKESDRTAYIRAWFRDIGIPENAIRGEYQTQENGSADIYLTNRRIIIEVKQPDRLVKGPHTEGTGSRHNESAFEQVWRYIADERPREEEHLDEVDNDLSWLGIVTDGCNWHLWESTKQSGGRYSHPRPINGWESTAVTKNNIKNLSSIINRKKVGKEWATADIVAEFSDVEHDLMKLYQDKKKILSSTQTQKGLWLEQLKGSGNNPTKEDEDIIFIKHTMLILISRMIVYPDLEKHLNEITEGFVNWVDMKEMDRLIEIMNRYNWRQHRGDVLSKLYEKFIPKSNRKSYGEYYTPDWLAEVICGKVIDDEFILQQIENYNSGNDVRFILDPACGSGTFLYHAVMRIINSIPIQNSGMSKNDVMIFACKLVRGIDIHPVAVEMARANIKRVFPNIDDANINIHQGDSLLIERAESKLHSQGNNLPLVSPQNRHLNIPNWLIKSPRDVSIFVQTAKQDNNLPRGIGSSLPGYNIDEITDAHNSLREIIREEANGVWKWYILNQAGPLNLKKSVGRIVSNPPWIRYSIIENAKRKTEIKNLGTELKLWKNTPKTSFDLAMLFVIRCIQVYMDKKDGIISGWVIPQGSMKSSGWRMFRNQLGDKITGIWDLQRLPFKNTPTCVTYFNVNVKSGILTKKEREVLEQYDSWKTIEAKTKWTKAQEFEKIMSEWIENKQHGNSRKNRKSRPLARNGITIYPYCLTWIKTMKPNNKGMMEITTRESPKSPWNSFGSLDGEIPPEWIMRCIDSDDLVSFLLPTTTKCIVPFKDKKLDNTRYDNSYWKLAQEYYGSKRNNKKLESVIRESLIKTQFKKNKNCVVYNKAGDNLYAARLKNREHLVLNSMFFVPCESENEALFLTSILNADILLPAFKSTRKSDRDFVSHFWLEVPIPKYNDNDKNHKKLVKLSLQAENIAEATYNSRLTLGKNRNSIKDALRKNDVSGNIDQLCKIILPNHVS